MSFDPEFDRATSKRPPGRGRSWPRWVGAAAVGLFLIALLLPASRSGRPTSRRMQCANCLYQVALGVRAYTVRYGALPPAFTTDPTGRPLHSWRTLILPFIDNEDVYRQVDLTKPWDDPANAEALQMMPGIFHCPEVSGGPTNKTTTYQAVVGPDACFRAGDPRRRAEIGGDLGATIMLIESDADSAVPWMAPRDADADKVPGMVAIGSEHGGETNAAFLDGGVRSLGTDTPAAEVRAMTSVKPAGG